MIISLIVLFLPVFLVAMLPCVLYLSCRRGQPGESVVKKFFNTSGASTNDVAADQDMEQNSQGVTTKCDGEHIPLTIEPTKGTRLNNRRASSIADEAELQG